MAAACGAVALIISRLAFGKADITMALNGALAGLFQYSGASFWFHAASMFIGPLVV